MAKRIMVVNDTQEILELFEMLLTEAGYEVFLYAFAITDLDEFDRVKPDLIILDYIFGLEKFGWELLQKLKMNRSTARIPIIICTAAVNAVREVEGYLQAKGISVVAKPFDIDDLLDAVKRALEMQDNLADVRDNEDDQTANT